MKPRRILLPGWKVDAIRKGATQLRVVCNPQPKWDGLIFCDWLDCDAEPEDQKYGYWNDDGDWPCPYGGPGQRLWVPETWQVRDDMSFYTRDPLKLHRTTNPRCKELWESMQPARCSKQWRSPATMPHWAWEATSNHILIQVTDVRVQQVQEISEGDAKAEGTVEYMGLDAQWKKIARFAVLAHFWDSTHPKPEEKWAANPWAWALTFEVLEGVT